MKKPSIRRLAATALMAGFATLNSAKAADTTLTTFDGPFTPNALYASWSGATTSSTSSNYVITATGYGSMWKQVGPINASGASNIVFDVDLSGNAGADGAIGVIVDLTDNDNTQISYRWFGRSRGHHILIANLFTTNILATDNGIAVTNNAFRIVTNAPGGTAGLDTSILWHVNVELDPSSYGQAYTIAMNDLKLTSGTGGGGGTSTNECAVISSFDNTSLNAGTANWTSQISTPSNIQITATGFGDGWNVCSANTDSNATLTLNVTLAATAAANGKLGPIVVLEDGDGTQLRYTFYGQNPSTNLVLISALSAGSQVAPGSTSGFNFSTISFFHVQLDPSSYAGSYTVSWNNLGVTGCTNSQPPLGNDVCATIDNFNSDFMAGYYPNWSVANEVSGPNSLSMTATGFGGGYHGVFPNVATESNKVLRLDVTLTAPAVANGKLGPIVVLQDGDGTQLTYAFYGQNPATNLILTRVLSAGVPVEAQPGGTPGFDFSTISFFHLQLDPSSYAGSYTVAFNNLDVFGCTTVPITIMYYSYDRSSQQFTLTWTSDPSASYAIQSSSDLQAGFTDIATGIPSAGSTTTVSVPLSDPSKGFVRVRKE